MLSVSETTCLLLAIRFVLAFLLAADKVLQSYARNLRAPALNCAQDDRCIFEITSSNISEKPAFFWLGYFWKREIQDNY